MYENVPFLPMSRQEMKKLGWDSIDILLLTGDAYVEHPSFGTAVIGRYLLDKGFRVGVVAQPDWKDPASLQVMGRPNIACGVSSGNMDSMVCIYTVGRRALDYFNFRHVPIKQSWQGNGRHLRRWSMPSWRNGRFRVFRSFSAAWRPVSGGWRTTTTGRTGCIRRFWWTRRRIS